MPGLIRRTDIDEVRSRVNIADIVGDYVTLKSAGVGSLKGLCPFHEERSPSFHVRPGVGRYHCFGCGEDGDVFTFLQRMDHVSFQEAVERMAARVGIELHYEDGGAAASDHGNRARLLAANAAAEQYFRAQLAEPGAQPARDFLGGRGFDQAAAERFGVGYAPKSFDALKNALQGQGFTQDELTAAGLLSTGERGNSYDRFRGRVIWPIRDVTGQTVGFGARKLFDDDQGPKYLNTPETLVFHKSQVLYGLDLARRDVAKSKQVVIVEGYTDVMACHLAGVTTAVATCGTAFGVDHIKVVRRVLGDVDNAAVSQTGEVVFTFDPDEAGQRAASRAFAEEQRFAAQTFVAVAPEGLDPCDLRIHRGDEAVRKLITDRKPMFEFMIRRSLAGHDLETVEGRVAALRAGAPVVAGIRDPALRGGYVRNLAGWLGMDPGEVGRAVTSAGNTSRRTDSRVDGDPRRPESDAAEPPRPRQANLTELPTDPVTRMERDALMAILQYPQQVGPALVAKAVEARFTNPTLAVVRDGVRGQLDHLDSGEWLQRVAEEVPQGFDSLVTQLGIAPIPERAEQIAIYCRGVVTSLVDRDLLRRKGELLGAMQRARAEGDREREAALSRESLALESERRELRGE
ncbi:DNA primase [Protaetiibacter mangrovi]|uniref:DNA primase n=1 Tax=Protaetiibacter mangrovi TaxID=2970926 RepID=A0ABT1ZBJ9_9MICO|nr:DNA primase [Protaetiibacter mangrovi]MCS0498063.1 DNA primase [Protaetiibacter mangrovi]